MANQIFRKKSMDKVSSPEELNDYVKVSTPSVWVILASVVIILIGVFVWSIFGTLDTVIKTVGFSEDGIFNCYIKEADIDRIGEDTTLTINGDEFAIYELSKQAIQIDTSIDEYAMHIGDLMVGEWVYEAKVKTSLPKGTYAVRIVIESVSPLSFVIN